MTGMSQEAESASDSQRAAAERRHLLAALALVRQALVRHCARCRGEEEPALQQQESDPSRLEQSLTAAASALPGPAPLQRLCSAFGLSSFERDLLLLCAGVELDSSFAGLCAQAMGQPASDRSQAALPTFSLALAALPDAHWDALTPEAPLRHWQLLALGSGATLTMTPLRIDEPILHYLIGLPYHDPRLSLLLPVAPVAGELLPSQQRACARLRAAWSEQRASSSPWSGPGQQRWPLIILAVPQEQDGLRLAARACQELGLRLHALSATDLPLACAERERWARLWERQAMLTGSALLLDCSQLTPEDRPTRQAVEHLARLLQTPLILSCREAATLRLALAPTSLVSIELEPLPLAEQEQLWRRALSALPLAADLNGHVEALAMQFPLGGAAIERVCAQLLPEPAPLELSADEVAQRLWHACRLQARPVLDDLAQRLTPTADWEQLVLPDEQQRLLHEIVAHVRQRATVYERWGFGRQGARGLGISALFAGSSGTGKTLAAEIIAHELQLDLYRIDLSAVVSKYIGETEKNLRRIFDAAEEGGAVLLFDEADALFGKRSEVKDSHDRYANIEVGYLLQRMETYRGLAILTTNLKHALDPAFLRRLRFIVHFPFPDVAMRLEIWRRIFPPDLPRENLDLEKLARLHVAGGNIRNIALYGAFLAAEAGESLHMSHLLRAAAVEYAKLEKPLTEAEIGGW
ncbi:ATP-binding protein, partial [Thermogemmatispora sp.]|uniref:ATP-binding protein n=1 Tax=Thermogemmatispora sp. TaxID=1968838 RepID=UPI0026188FDA